MLRPRGWSRQQPVERARQRDEAAIGEGYEERWPTLKTGQQRKGVPASGETKRAAICYLLPVAVRTGAPRGQTPLLRVTLTHDHLAASSGLTLEGRLFWPVREPRYDRAAVVGFLRVLRRQVAGKLLVIWVGAPIHRGQAVKAVLKRGAATRVHLEPVPGYAPDLNPDEGIWTYLKRVAFGTVCCTDLGDLRAHLIRARERLRHTREVIRACSHQCGYLV